jgi:amidase
MTDVYWFHPAPARLAYTFGGREPVLRVLAGDLTELSTEDCFGGKLRVLMIFHPWCVSSRT